MNDTEKLKLLIQQCKEAIANYSHKLFLESDFYKSIKGGN